MASDPIETYLVENPLCPTIARYVYPKRGLTKDEEFKFIINEPDTAYIQAVRVSCKRFTNIKKLYFKNDS